MILLIDCLINIFQLNVFLRLRTDTNTYADIIIGRTLNDTVEIYMNQMGRPF